MNQFSCSVQSLSHVWLCDSVDCSTPGLPVHHQLAEFTQTHVHWVGDAIQPSHPLLSPSLPTFNLSQHQGLFRWVSSSYQVAKKYWSFSFSISPSSEYSGLISFRIDWFDLLVVQGTLKSLLQHHSSKASVLQPSAFFMGQLSHASMTTGKSIPLTLWTFVSEVTSLLFNMLSSFAIAFLPRRKHLLISCYSRHLQWFWSPGTICSHCASSRHFWLDLNPLISSCHVFILFLTQIPVYAISLAFASPNRLLS